MPTPHHKGQPESLGLPKLRPPSPKTDTADVPHDDDADMQTVRVSESHPRDDTDTSTSNESELAANLPCLANVTPMDTSPRDGLGSGEIQYQTLPRRQSSSLKVLRPALPSTPMVMLQRTKTLGSLHADKMLTRLGVTFETMRLEKGMKKLGICDHDIEASIEIRRHCGVVLNDLMSKEELLLGFSGKQLKRIKAVKTMGTSENEILDVYCKQISNLGFPQEAAALLK